MKRKIEKYERFDISGKPYTEHNIELEEMAWLRFSVNNNDCHKDDRGFVLLDIHRRDTMVESCITFGMDKKTARAFARKLLEITE